MHMRSDRRISIVVPCYNRAAYLNVLLQSLTWSSVRPSDFEVVVVNDGGVDHVELVAETWRRKGLDIHVRQLRRSGPPRNNAVARNTGLRMARYPIVLHTDPDIVFVSDVLAHVQRDLEPGVFCSCSAYYPLTRDATLALAFTASGPDTGPDAYLAQADGRPNQVLSPDGVQGLHGAFACAKDDLAGVGGYDESFEHWGWEDRELLVTLTRQAGLTRRYMPSTPVVHLWHPLLRSNTVRVELASRGRLSRIAWELQLQRVAAEHPRAGRPRRGTHVSTDTDPRAVFALDAYAAWEQSSETASTAPLTRRSATHQPDRVPTVFQFFFDAHRLEATELRSSGHTALARTLLCYTLRRPWERPLPRREWVASDWPDHLDLDPSGVDTAIELPPYDNLDLALEELAACEQDLGNSGHRAVVLRMLDRLPGTQARVAAAHARAALHGGDVRGAREQSDRLGSTALGIELALLTGQFGEAATTLQTCLAAMKALDANIFDRLRFFGYLRLLEYLVPGSTIDTRPQPKTTDQIVPLANERSELLYSAAMRSVREDLDIGASVLLGRFLQSGSPAEPRLYTEGRQHLAAAHERISHRSTPDMATTLLAAFDAITQTHHAALSPLTGPHSSPLDSRYDRRRSNTMRWG